MGPDDNQDVSSTTSTEKVTVPKLRADGSNWAIYAERVMNYVISKGLRRHILGTVRKPVNLVEQNGSFYKPGQLAPLTDEEVEKHEDEVDNYLTKQAAVREVVYRTIDTSTFLQVKNELDAAAVWKKMISIHADKGSMYETTLLTQLQTIRFTDGDDMREHLANMNQIRERLAEINCSLSDESFMTYIRTSVSLVPSYKTLITTLTATSRVSGKKLTSTDLAWHLQEEADSALHEENMNKSNAAMVAAVAKMQGRESKKDKKFCTNCEKPGHTKDDCWAKGGGKEGQRPKSFR